MAAYTAIAEVSQTLRELLCEELTAREDIVSFDADQISLVNPADVSSDDQTRLSISLYHLEENASMKNSQPRQTTDPNIAEGSPLVVDLYYLVTAHTGGSENSTAQTVEQQRVLGLTLQTFQDNAILSGEQLPKGLKADGPLTVSLVNHSLSERTNRWSAAPETAFQPSVLYQVRSAVIDSRKREQLQPVTERETALSRQPDT